MCDYRLWGNRPGWVGRLVSMLALVLLLAVQGCSQADGPAAPEAAAGVLDLSDWEFSRGGPVPLRGEWAVRGTMVPAGQAVMRQPGTLEGLGVATLTLTVALPPDAPPLALAVPNVISAYRLVVNGDVLLRTGSVAGDAAAEVPVLAGKLVPMPASGLLEIAIELSNHHHFEGGLRRPVVLGPVDRLTRAAAIRHGVAAAVFGALVLLFCLLLAVYLGGGRDATALTVAAFVALLAVRVFVNGQLPAAIFGDVRADLGIWLPNFFVLFVFPGVYLALLRRFFPGEVPRGAVAPLLGLGGSMVAAALIVPSAIYTQARLPGLAMVVVALVAGTGFLVRAVRRRRPAAAWLLTGTVVVLVTLVHDIAESGRLTDGSDLGPLRIALFAMCCSAALAQKLLLSERALTQRLAELNRDLERKVDERTASLAEAKAAAEAASQAKSEFLAVMGHEIRTPLHGWTGLIELLEETGLNERQRQYLGLLRQTAGHLTQLIGGILDMARIEAGRLELETIPFRPAELVGELEAFGQTRAAGQGLAFDVVVGPGLPEVVTGDPRGIRQVLFNFLDNAFKFTGSGHVRLAVEARGEGALVRFSVTDTGCGIPDGRRQEMFQSFTQLDPSTRRLHGGSGLGLAICRRLAEAMGGQVGVEAADGGGGSTFWCELALPAADPAAIAAAPRAPASDVRQSLGGRVLFADDVPLNRLVFRDFLAGTGCHVDEAGDGAEAVAKARSGTYDVVVLDLRMPGMDGFEAARAIRDHEAAQARPRVPLVALTAGATAAERRLAREAGFDEFLTKPTTRDGLLTALATLLPVPQSGSPLPPPPNIPEGLEHLMPVFLAEMEKDSLAVGELVGGGDRDSLAEYAHAARGKCGMFGEDRLFDLYTRLETAAPTAAIPEMRELVALIVERVTQLRLYEVGCDVAPPAAAPG